MIRVLALNDDNHDTTFYLENDSAGYGMRGLLKALVCSHSESYHIRYVYLIDIPDDDTKAQEAFDIIDCNIKSKMSWSEAYDFLWNVYAKEW